jgi:antitoxin YefM
MVQQPPELTHRYKRTGRSLTNILIQPIIIVMKTMSLAAAKTRFSALVDEAVTTHEQVTVTRNGEPAVVVLAVEDYESLLETLAILQDPADRAQFEQARREADEGDVIEEEEMAALIRERLARRAVR